MPLFFLLSILCGYVLFHLVLKLIPYLEKKDHSLQRGEVLKEASLQRDAILKGATEQLDQRLSIQSEELETLLIESKDDLKREEIDLSERELLFNLENQRIQQLEDLQKQREISVQETDKMLKERERELETTQKKLISQLEVCAQTHASSLKKFLSDGYINEKQLEIQKVTKFLQEELNSAGSKLARRILDRTHARYAPDFIWPKSSNVLEVKELHLHPILLKENCELLERLQEKSGIKIVPFQPAEGILFIRTAGGFGISREAVRLTLEKILTQDAHQWSKATNLYESHCLRLEAEAARLGKKAIEILGLKGVHVELQKLVGALNWRTSYRQNQWYHTVEVAQFASILAHELGVNPDDAKRVGLLHDIGKAIDYRIDGSHAVISGDYADRFGEKRYICDTVMSHHSDLLVETPLAYILQAADTLSGARPGARVNLEEGYQVRLTAIHDVVKSFPGIQDLAVMNGGREVHILVQNELVSEAELKPLTEAIARKIEQEVAYPGQIKIMVTRTFESSAVA